MAAGPKFAPPPLSTAIASAFVCGLFYGLYLVTYFYANRWLLFSDEGWKLRKNFHWLMITVANVIGMLLLADTTIVVQVLMSQMDFIDVGHKPKEWASPPWSAIVKCATANLIALLADIVLMYRLWLVFGRRMWIMWFPIILWLGGFVCTILEIFMQVVHIHNPNFGPYQWAAVNMNVGPGIVLIPFWLSTIVLNAFCTGILIWKIWGASKNNGDHASSTRQLQLLVRILMESGILYLVIGLAHFFVWFGKDASAIGLLGTINTVVVAIAFNLVLIRTAQNKAEDENFNNGSGVLTSIHFSPKPGANRDDSVETDIGSSDPERAAKGSLGRA